MIRGNASRFWDVGCRTLTLLQETSVQNRGFGLAVWAPDAIMQGGTAAGRHGGDLPHRLKHHQRRMTKPFSPTPAEPLWDCKGLFLQIPVRFLTEKDLALGWSPARAASSQQPATPAGAPRPFPGPVGDNPASPHAEWMHRGSRGSREAEQSQALPVGDGDVLYQGSEGTVGRWYYIQ